MKPDTPPPTRRERQRADTVADIKASAREHLAKSGPSAVSLRAVARDLGVSAPALYRYFPSHEALMTAMCVDYYDELGAYMWAQCEQLPEADAMGRLLTAARSFRAWAVANRAEFSLMFASQVPGAVLAKPGSTSADLDPEAEPYASMLRFSSLFGALFTRCHTQTDAERGFALTAPDPPPMPQALREEIQRCAAMVGMHVPFRFAYVFHSFWIRLYGMVAMEIFGQLPVVQEAEALLEAELIHMARLVGAPDVS